MEESQVLVLTRKKEESLLVGEGVRITILKVRGNQVRIGIEAPRDVRVLRAELDDWSELRFDDRAVEGERLAPLAEIVSARN